MIQPAALPSVPGLPLLAEMVATPVATGLEGADFSALLAIEAAGAAPPVAAAILPTPPAPTVPTALPAAPVLPEGGKDLPPALPVVVAGEEAPPAPQPQPSPTALARPVRGPRQATVTEPAPAPKRGDEAPVASALAEAPNLAVAPVAAAQEAAPSVPGPQTPPPGPAVTAAVAATPTLRPEAPRAASVASSVAQPAPAALPVQTEPREPSPAVPSPASAAQQPNPAAITLAVIAAPALAAPRLAEVRMRPHQTTPGEANALRIAEPQPNLIFVEIGTASATESPTRPPIESRLPPAAIAVERAQLADRFTLAPPSAEPPLLALPTAPAAPALPAPLGLAAADPAARPLDFTQLVDRLVAARELAQPQAFQVSLQHAEFGPVQLRFQREGEGLNITMASADPDFARVVNAAPAPLLPPLTSSDPAAGQSGPRAESQSQSAAGNGQRGASPDRREDRHGPADNPPSARQRESHDNRRGGIFA